MELRRYVRWLFSPAEGLSNRAVHSGVWSFALNGANRVVQLLKTIILANLLSPDAFGLVAIAIITFEVSQKITDIGFDHALVQRKESNVDEYIDTTWVVQAFRGVVLLVSLSLVAPLIATWFSDPRLTPVIRVFALVALLDGVINPAIIYFQKDLELHREFGYRFSGTVANVGTAILTAVWYETFWALVVGIIAGKIVELLMSFVVTDYRPKFRFNRDLAGELLQFSKWVYTSSITIYIAQQGDDSLVGWLLGSSALGLYRLSFQFGNAPATEIANVVSSVTFPLYSKLQDDTPALRHTFKRVTEAVFVAALPATVGIVLVAPPFTKVVLGEQWTPMIPALQILVIGGFVRTVAQTGRSLFRGCGVPRWDFWMNVVRLAVILLTIWPLTQEFGIEGAALSVTLGLFSMLPLWLFQTQRITETPFRHYLKIFLVPASASVVMAVPVYLVRRPTLFGFLASVTVGVFVYSVTIYAILRILGRRPVAELRQITETLS
ncbi:lipopolysaccharide biosynthesis protein [Halorussus amylolyticus]|uniref:lipopolysaccharide biosynthesis protein n=1 Tax=Halorussus amylolyticus TaxID=1126242 RepID=UPI00104FFFA9|nr:lipopolysaccharide biosynthesis protein [Halorussus amylolyticus]